MRIANYSVAGRRAIGLVTDTGLVDLSRRLKLGACDMPTFIENWASHAGAVKALESADADHALADVVLHAPVQRPGKIMALGLNYADHLRETGREPPQHQMWFTKAVTSVADPFGPVELPRVSSLLDYEVELVMVIGRRARHVSAGDAASVVFGYAVGNDFSVRDWQLMTSQFTLGKSFDTHAPYGPWIVTADALDPHGLDIRCSVNGDLRQSSNTREMIFNCWQQIEMLSAAMTLEPGDVIFTGTPAGIGHVRTPPQYLKPGDVVRSEVSGLGYIENRISAEL